MSTLIFRFGVEILGHLDLCLPVCLRSEFLKAEMSCLTVLFRHIANMTSPLRSASHSTRIYKLEEMFLGLFLRHILIEKDGEYIGMLSIGDVLRAGLLEKDRQFKEINDFVSWDYYQNWKAGRSKKR